MNAPPQLEIITALRGLAALSVVWFHFATSPRLASVSWLKDAGWHGWLGVYVFFVISGFVIALTLHHRAYKVPAAGRFLLKRVIRIYPPYLVTIAGTIALVYAASALPWFRGAEPSLDPVQLVLHLGYLNDLFGYPWVVLVMWSLAIEFQFYLLIAAGFPLIVHDSTWVRIGTLAAMCLSAFLVPSGLFVFHYLPLFAIGLLAFTHYVGKTSLPLYLALLVPAWICVAASSGPVIAVAAAITALLISFARMPSFGPLAFLGAISYSLYLIHLPIGGRVLNIGARFATDTPSFIAVLASAIAATIAASYLMYRFVEQPAMKWAASVRYKA